MPWLLSPFSSPETIASWDSFNSYILLDELESEFKTEFTMEFPDWFRHPKRPHFQMNS